jgi:hypothetical protein
MLSLSEHVHVTTQMYSSKRKTPAQINLHITGYRDSHQLKLKFASDGGGMKVVYGKGKGDVITDCIYLCCASVQTIDSTELQ